MWSEALDVKKFGWETFKRDFYFSQNRNDGHKLREEEEEECIFVIILP